MRQRGCSIINTNKHCFDYGKEQLVNIPREIEDSHGRNLLHKALLSQLTGCKGIPYL
jgi:hypothetical protein